MNEHSSPGNPGNLQDDRSRMPRRMAGILAVVLLLLAGTMLAWLLTPATARADVRVGWQYLWATQGQIIKTLENTNIPELYGVSIDFKGFEYGPPINDAARSNAIDCTNIGIVPTINLLATDENWLIVARQIDFEVSIVARPGANISAVKDLADKRLAIPVAGGSHPYAIKRIRECNLTIGKDAGTVRMVNLSPADTPATMKQGGVDAAATWEPTTTLLINQGGQVIDRARYLGFILVRKSFAEKKRREVISLLKAYLEANYYVARHRDQTDEWFATAAGMDLGLVKAINVIEPNVHARLIDDINLRVSDADIDMTQGVVQDMMSAVPEPLIPKPVRISSHVSMEYLNAAVEELKAGAKTDHVRVKLP